MAAALDLPDTFADVLDRLGGVPPERVLLRPAPGTATEADLIAARLGPGRRLCELIDGVLVERKRMSFREAVLATKLGADLYGHAADHDLGVVAGADAQVRFRLGLVRIPDVCFVPWSRIPGDELPDEAVASVVPTLAVEVLSKSNTPREIEQKLTDYFENGVRLVWVIDPSSETARVYTSANRHKQLSSSDALDGGRVLPGFKLPLADLFAVTKRRKKGKPK
jgi:Uma2 family endonuclease